MKQIELNDTVVTNFANPRFAEVRGLGKYVGEVKLRFFDGSEGDFDSRNLTAVDPKMCVLAEEMLDLLKRIQEKWISPESHYWGSETNLRIEKVIKKATE